MSDTSYAAYVAGVIRPTPGAVLAVGHSYGGVIATRVKAIREIRLDDVDLGNRRIVTGGRAARSTTSPARP